MRRFSFELPTKAPHPSEQGSGTMKILMIIAASFTSTMLVLPTVSQGQVGAAAAQVQIDKA